MRVKCSTTLTDRFNLCSGPEWLKLSHLFAPVADSEIFQSSLSILAIDKSIP